MTSMRMPRPTTIDFETFGIEQRPAYPPKPVGVAVKEWGKKSRYYAWGHPTGNNCTRETAQRALADAWSCSDGVLMQNAKFDVDVAETYLAAPRLSWSSYHDTMYLLFLNDPHAESLSLKPSAERILGLPPEEQDAVCEWLVTHNPIPGVRISKAQKSEHYFARYIAYAPGDLVGKYACGDVDRTEALFKWNWKKVITEGKMLEAYDRERRLMPLLLDGEREGVDIDHERLAADAKLYIATFDALNNHLCKVLKAPELNLDSGAQLVEAMLRAGKVDQRLLGLTPKGQVCTDKAALERCVTDPALAVALRYRMQLKTCLSTFMLPWLEMVNTSGGKLYTTWNQVRDTGSGKSKGTRTGRLSSTPNFQNIPNEFKGDLPKVKGAKIPPLPVMRSYIIAPKGHVLIGRDYSQQELRILAHFEDGALKDAYLKDNWLDVHDYARGMISRMLGREMERKPIKNTGFGIIYGMGVGLLAENSGITVEEAREVKNAYLAIFPGLREMYRDMKCRAMADEPIRTWGSRSYLCEPPRMINGERVTFDYKMLNVLVQGSAADCTKEAVVHYHDVKPLEHKMLINVHDELLCAVPEKDVERGMQVLKESMESVEFDVPMLSEGKWSAMNWAEMKDYDIKGVRCAG